MNIRNDPRFHILQSQRDALADSWHRAIVPTSVAPFTPPDVRLYLGVLTDQVIAMLLGEVFERKQAQVIGAALLQIYDVHHKALGQTLEVLAQGLVAGFTAEQALALQPRLAAVLGEIAAGFFRQACATILLEQERIRTTLVDERTVVEAALRVSEERLRTVLANVPVILFVTDHIGVITLVEGKALQSLGVPASRIVGQLIFAVAPTLPQVNAPQMLEHFNRALAGEAFTVLGKMAGSVFETRYGPLCNSQNIIVGVIGVSIDITERTRVEAALDAAHKRLMVSQEQERLHLAQELHDDALQHLLAITHQLGMSDRSLHGTAQRPEAIRQEILAVVRQLRALIGELRPPLLAEFGLTAALEALVERMHMDRGHSGVEIDLDLDECETRLPQPITLCLYRTAQEALRNALQHAQAQSITLRLRLLPGEVVLSVHDDGCGFNVPDRLSDLTRAHHFGLMGVAERVAWVGGHFTLRSAPDAGADLTVRVPWEERGQADDQDNSGGAGR